MPSTHVPERTCVACRRKRPQHEFTRIARVNGVWAVQDGPRTGRGAYVCADSPTCWAEKRLRRAFGSAAGSVSARLQAGHGDRHPIPSGHLMQTES